MSISWVNERYKDVNARSSMSRAAQLRLAVAEYGVLVWMSVLVALIGSLVSTSTLWLQTLREGYCLDKWYLARPACDNFVEYGKPLQFFVYLFLSCVYATLASLLVKKVPQSAMSGITQLKSYFQGFIIHNLLDLKPLLVKLVGMVLATGSGLYIGQEAPLAYVGVVLTSVLCQVLPLSEARRRELGLAGAATGIAVAFGAPLGGVLFILEVFLLDTNVSVQKAVWACFVCSAVAVVMLRGVGYVSSTWAGLLLPETGLFKTSFDRVWQGVETLPFMALGALGGVYGFLVLEVSFKLRKVYTKYPLISVLIVSLVTSTGAYFTELSRMPSMELLADLFAECTSNQENKKLCVNEHVLGLLFTFVWAAFWAPCSFTLQVPSGILFPSIMVGALGGRLMGLLMRSVLESMPLFLSTRFCPDEQQHCVTPGVYALVGAASSLCGVTGLTISSVVIIFETTGALSFIVPIMTGVIVAKFVGDTFGNSKTIYTNWQADEHLPFLPDTQSPIPNKPAHTIMQTDLETVSIEQALEIEQGVMVPLRHTCVPVVSDITSKYQKLIVAKSGVEEPTLVLNQESSLLLVVSAMTKLGIRVIVFCERGKLVGLITRNDLVRYFDSAAVEFDAAADEFEIY